MAAVSVTTSSTPLLAAGASNRFCDIENNSAQVVYVTYDGTAATVAGGIPIAINGILQLSGRERCDRGVNAIVAATTSDVRVING